MAVGTFLQLSQQDTEDRNNIVKGKSRCLVKVKVNIDCIAPRRENLTSKALRCDHTVLPANNTTPAFTRSSPGGATTE